MNKELLGISITTGTYQSILTQIIDLTKKRTKGYICFTNVHMTIETLNDKSFRNIVNEATMAVPDGMPIAKGIQIKYKQKQARIPGMDILPEIIKLADQNKLSIFILGSSNKNLEAVKKKIKHQFKNIKVAGTFSPMVTEDMPQEEIDEHLKIINDSKPHIVVVALGCPKQEKWMARNYKNINALLLGLGGAVDVYAGAQRRAPQFLQKMGLEWTYRLFQEPKRLWKRYLYTNTYFLYKAIPEIIRHRIML